MKRTLIAIGLIVLAAGIVYWFIAKKPAAPSPAGQTKNVPAANQTQTPAQTPPSPLDANDNLDQALQDLQTLEGQ